MTDAAPTHTDDPPHWSTFGVNHHPASARERNTDVPPRLAAIVDERLSHYGEPFTGVTTDGIAPTGLRSLDDGSRVDTAAVTEAALVFLARLDSAQRTQAMLPMDAVEWRGWINVHMNYTRHGVMLEDLPATARQAALDLVAAALSARGNTLARNIMTVNEFVATLSDNYIAFGQWPYFVTIFGDPSGDEPWGWQLDGHHLNLNCVVLPDRLVMTPAFMGSEPRSFRDGPLAGTLMFDREEGLGLDLIRSLAPAQRDRAIIHTSISKADLPHLQHPFDGRMQAGAFRDNAVLPYQGIVGADLTGPQRRLLTTLAGTYAAWNRDDLAAITHREIEAHLDDTWFSWYGGHDDAAPFYYRLHSPIILIEFDHHPGVVFDNPEPTRHHVHTLVRTPNGGDYGADLLRQHYERHDHSTGCH